MMELLMLENLASIQCQEHLLEEITHGEMKGNYGFPLLLKLFALMDLVNLLESTLYWLMMTIRLLKYAVVSP